MLTRGSRRAVAQLQAVLANDIEATRCVSTGNPSHSLDIHVKSDCAVAAGLCELSALLLLRPQSPRPSPKEQCLVV